MQQSTNYIKVVGFDPSLRNWGISIGNYDTVSKRLIIEKVDVTQPVLSTNKQVRTNSLDLESSKQLAEAAIEACKGARAIFVEVPVGSQSARAMASYGICVGVLGTLRAMGIPFFEVSPSEVKLVSVGKATATKKDMINWMIKSHPEALLPLHNGKVIESKAEHMADATAAIHAGVESTLFKQMLTISATI